jgi:predicted aldo/keto reductase-like oxidoreductase
MKSAFEGIFPIGLGTARFPFTRPAEFETDFENAVDLVLYALDRGINYIDVGRGYSDGKALSVLKEAFKRTDRPYNVCVKVNCYGRLTAGNYYKEALSVLDEMGLERATHFLLWTLMDSAMLKKATKPGSLYDTALRLKEEGKVGSVGCSVHMKRGEILELIDTGLFEYVLISYNLLNFVDFLEVLDAAREKNVDILVMNPLYGGLIPKNASLFEFAKCGKDETVVQAAVRAVLSHPAVKCVLAGAENKAQLDEYLSALNGEFTTENKALRIQKIARHIHESKFFCSYCRYCAGCSVGIPVSELMNARNVFVLNDNKSEIQAKKIFFQLLHEKFGTDFESADNPCIKCGKCEKKCTQHLDIVKSLDEIYNMVAETCYDNASRKKRLDELLHCKPYKKVGFWPASAGTEKILSIYRNIFGEFPFEVVLFDSNAVIGEQKFGYAVRKKAEAKALMIECMLVTSFNYGLVIYEQIKDLEQFGMDVKILYRSGDVDWWW